MSRDARVKYTGLIFFLAISLTLLMMLEGKNLITDTLVKAQSGDETINVVIGVLGFGAAFLTSDAIGYVFNSIVVFVLNILAYLPRSVRKNTSELGVVILWFCSVVSALQQDLVGLIFFSVLSLGFLGILLRPTISFYSWEFDEFGEKFKQIRIGDLSRDLPLKSHTLIPEVESISPDVFSSQQWFLNNDQINEWFVRRYSAFFINYTTVLATLSGLAFSQYLIVRFKLNNTFETRVIFWGGLILVAMLIYNAQQARQDALQMLKLNLVQKYNKDRSECG